MLCRSAVIAALISASDCNGREEQAVARPRSGKFPPRRNLSELQIAKINSAAVSKAMAKSRVLWLQRAIVANMSIIS